MSGRRKLSARQNYLLAHDKNSMKLSIIFNFVRERDSELMFRLQSKKETSTTNSKDSKRECKRRKSGGLSY